MRASRRFPSGRFGLGWRGGGTAVDFRAGARALGRVVFGNGALVRNSPVDLREDQVVLAIQKDKLALDPSPYERPELDVAEVCPRALNARCVPPVQQVFYDAPVRQRRALFGVVASLQALLERRPFARILSEKLSENISKLSGAGFFNVTASSFGCQPAREWAVRLYSSDLSVEPMTVVSQCFMDDRGQDRVAHSPVASGPHQLLDLAQRLTPDSRTSSAHYPCTLSLALCTGIPHICRLVTPTSLPSGGA